MSIEIYPDKTSCSKAAAQRGASAIRQAIAEHGSASIIVATGASQLEMLTTLSQDAMIDWSKVTLFHLDEYAGLSANNPASFRRYIRERFIEKLPCPPAAAHFVDGEATDLCLMCDSLGEELKRHPIDVCFIGIGENGHIAFNDPPANFDTEDPYLIVELDEACRRQQLGEGWFKALEEVPRRAISMSVRQILKSRIIINTVPDYRKSIALRNALEGELSPACPASIIRLHPCCYTFCDQFSASGLANVTRELCAAK